MGTSGEFELIARIAHRLTGAGDDAAVLDIGGAKLVAAADAVVRGRHWTDELSSPEDAGWKALAVNLSDLAAMGDVRPRAALVTLLKPHDVDLGYVEALYAGLHEAAAVYGVDLAGGDTCAAADLALSVAILGELRGTPVLRSGARPGDALVVVGALAAGAAALAAHRAGRHPLPAHLAAHRRPRPLLAAGAALAAHGATAMLDVSDGLGQDLAHLCRASGVDARVDWSAVPVADGVRELAAALGADPVALACGGGEDYALVAAVPAARAEAAAAAAAQADGVPAAVVGVCAARPEPAAPIVELHDASGARDIAGLGWDHFGRQEER